MSSVAIRNNFSAVVETVLAGDSKAIESVASDLIVRAEDASELIARIGLLAMQGDSDGHTVLTLGAAAKLCHQLIALRHVLGDESDGLTTGIPLVVQALTAATPAVKAGLNVVPNTPDPIFPSGLAPNETVSARMQAAIYSRDSETVERLLFGLYGTGADYRTLSIRIYDGIAQTFQENGHALLCAVRGSQVLDSVQWGEDTPFYIRWLIPHLIEGSKEPDWIVTVRSFLSDPQHSVASYRTRIAAPRNVNASPLRSLLLSKASPLQICQGVYDALITNGASASGVGSVIALAANDLLLQSGTDDHDLFIRASHGLLFASAVRLVYSQVQDIEALPLLFTAAAYINSLYTELAAQTSQKTQNAHPSAAGGGMIAPSLLESLLERIAARDVPGALATARRYIQLGHNVRALFAVIGLGAGYTDASADQGHTLQIVLAAGDEYLAWPKELAQTSIEGFLLTALYATVLGQRSL